MVDIFISKPPQPVEPKKEEPHVTAEVPKTESLKDKLGGHNHSPLSSFCLYPENINFETQENDEKIILLLRMHPITNVGWILITIAMLFVPTLISVFGLLESFPLGFGLVLSLAWYLITMAYAL